MKASSIRNIEELLSKCDDLLSAEFSTAPEELQMRFETRRLLQLATLARIRAEEREERNNWSEFDRTQVAEALLKEFPQLSINTLLAAVAACADKVQRDEGRPKLLSCTREYLIKNIGTGETSR